ncbi:unnamed protein product [Spirodela intermedia]|uniref:Uncharacterized protein n=1 Tax=Spirodela intermedia TaxID=51605 RepID=A0A7I8LKY3_SPIIN|nr:unnamed protein product [Spirodela intermedia]
MQRTGSTARATEEHFVGTMPAGTLPPAGGVSPPPGIQTRRLSAVEGTAESDSLLPKYDPQSTFAKKEAARSRSAESAIHLIPVILITCAFILWFFSNPRKPFELPT